MWIFINNYSNTVYKELEILKLLLKEILIKRKDEFYE
jgi:hypothetical protein